MLLEVIRDAVSFIREVTHGKTLDEYRADRVLRQAVEQTLKSSAKPWAH